MVRSDPFPSPQEWRCEACGAPIAPQAMVRRLEEKITSTLSMITRYCQDGSLKFAALPIQPREGIEEVWIGEQWENG